MTYGDSTKGQRDIDRQEQKNRKKGPKKETIKRSRKSLIGTQNDSYSYHKLQASAMFCLSLPRMLISHRFPPRNSRGLLSIGEGMQCLCHLDGNCYAKLLLPGTNVSW